MIDRYNGYTSLAVLRAMEVASQLDMEARSPERGSLHWYRVLRVLAMVDLSPLDSALGEINRNRLATLGRSPCRSGGPLIGPRSFPCPSFLGGLGAFVGLLLPLLEFLESR